MRQLPNRNPVIPDVFALYLLLELVGGLNQRDERFANVSDGLWPDFFQVDVLELGDDHLLSIGPKVGKVLMDFTS